MAYKKIAKNYGPLDTWVCTFPSQKAAPTYTKQDSMLKYIT
jgi:hypothetical protein